MKKLFTVLSVVLLSTMIWAQSPQKMSYQAVVRDLSNNLIKEQAVGMKISILQGSVSGTVVYTETQAPTTNADGLVSIEIGGGAGFSTINWANGTYFIKTETDPTGGTNYSITGTSQLLSVPYALHAKTAETITGTVTETDPVFTAWGKDYADLSNKPTLFSGSYSDLTNKPTIPAAADGSETKVRAGTNVTVTGTGTTASPYMVNAIGATTLTLGQNYQGGIIFWLDATGQHGLIAATTDQSAGIQWYNGNYRNTGTTGDGLYAGVMNTAMIVATQMTDYQTGNFAAKVCADYSVTEGGVTYGDWYLPSKYELNLLNALKFFVGGFANAYYWSSTESNNNYAWIQNFYNGSQITNIKNYASNCVRAIRAF